MTFCGFALEIGSPLGPGDKEGPSRVVTPRFSPSPPLRSFLSINPRKSQRTEILSSVRLLPFHFLPSFIAFSPLSLSPRRVKCLPYSFLFLFTPFLPRSFARCFSRVAVRRQLLPRALPPGPNSPARCPFISSSLPPLPPSSTGLPSPLSLPRHGFCPCPL